MPWLAHDVGPPKMILQTAAAFLCLPEFRCAMRARHGDDAGGSRHTELRPWLLAVIRRGAPAAEHARGGTRRDARCWQRWWPLLASSAAAGGSIIAWCTHCPARRSASIFAMREPWQAVAIGRGAAPGAKASRFRMPGYRLLGKSLCTRPRLGRCPGVSARPDSFCRRAIVSQG